MNRWKFELNGFDEDELSISHDNTTSSVLLSSIPSAKVWSEFFGFVRSIDVPVDFMAERPMNVSPQVRSLFADEVVL